MAGELRAGGHSGSGMGGRGPGARPCRAMKATEKCGLYLRAVDCTEGFK